MFYNSYFKASNFCLLMHSKKADQVGPALYFKNLSRQKLIWFILKLHFVRRHIKCISFVESLCYQNF